MDCPAGRPGDFLSFLRNRSLRVFGIDIIRVTLAPRKDSVPQGNGQMFNAVVLDWLLHVFGSKSKVWVSYRRLDET